VVQEITAVPKSRFRYWIVAGFLLIVAAGVLVALLPSYQPPPLPNPNGYDDFIAAKDVLVGDPYKQPRDDAPALQSYLNSNEESLRLIRLGLTRDSMINVHLDNLYFKRHMKDMVPLKKLSFLLELEGRLAELGQRTNDAAESFLDMVKFSHQAFRGGPIIDRTIGLACEVTAIRAMGRIISSLNAERSRKLIEALEQIESRREPVEDTLQNERLWARNNRTFREKVLMALPTDTARQVRKAREVTVQNILSRQKAMLKVMTDLAQQAFQLENKHIPGKIEELVPKYLKAVPKDPFSKKEMSLEAIRSIKVDEYDMPSFF